MNSANPKSKTKAFVVILLTLCAVAVIVGIKEVKKPDFVVASEDKRDDANKPLADSNAPEPGKSPDPNDPNAPPRPDHEHLAFKQRSEERKMMVDYQIKAREVRDPNVLKAMLTVPRHAFVPVSQQRYAYGDHPLPIGEGQTISQPYIVAFMTEALQLRPGSKVLEIGTGSGYQAAVCAEIAREVYTIEIVEPLAKSAQKLLKEIGYNNVFVRAGDGFFGWPEKGPYDAIIGTAAAGQIPPPLLEQLRPGGRMILPCGDDWGDQELVVLTKDQKGSIAKKSVMPVRFVPMTGQVQKPTEKSKR